MRTWLYPLISIALMLGGVQEAVSAPVLLQEAVQVQNCATTSNPICIKEILVKRQAEGSFTVAKLTGVTTPVDQISSGGLRLKGIKQEYQTPGIYFEGNQNDKILPSVELFPAITVPCPVTSCSPAREVIGVFVSPSYLNDPWQQRLITSPFRSDSKFCLSGTEKALCSRDLNFNIPLDIKMSIQIPSSYLITFIHGLAQRFSYSISESKLDGYSILTFNFSPIEHSGMLNSDWGKNASGEEGGDFLIDSTALWFFGKNDMWSKSIGPCAGSGAYGVVNNAVEMGEPQWSSEDSTLNVRLRAPHLNSKNEVTVGYFGAFISKSMAECLWKLDISNKSSARLAVTYVEGGKAEVLTAVSNYKNELFTLETSGFHYSSPTIKVKMVEEKTQPATQKTPTQNTPAKKTIFCVKGKIVKKIIGVKPKCPTGFKVKQS